MSLREVLGYLFWGVVSGVGAGLFATDLGAFGTGLGLVLFGHALAALTSYRVSLLVGSVTVSDT